MFKGRKISHYREISKINVIISGNKLGYWKPGTMIWIAKFDIWSSTLAKVSKRPFSRKYQL